MEVNRQHQLLIDKVIETITDDLRWNDTTAIDELLKSCPVENLIAFLDEKEWKQFNSLLKPQDDVTRSNGTPRRSGL